MENNYKYVADVSKYVDEIRTRNNAIELEAEKYARIRARQGKLGEEVITWSVDQNGNEIKEKVDTVKLDEETKEPGWVVTKADEEGTVILDNNRHDNSWIISDSVFKKKYEQLEPEYHFSNGEISALYKPTGGIQKFVKIPENIILNQWGSDMQIAAGGYINITNPEDMYGISERDFNDTYKETKRTIREVIRVAADQPDERRKYLQDVYNSSYNHQIDVSNANDIIDKTETSLEYDPSWKESADKEVKDYALLGEIDATMVIDKMNQAIQNIPNATTIKGENGDIHIIPGTDYTNGNNYTNNDNSTMYIEMSDEEANNYADSLLAEMEKNPEEVETNSRSK